MATPANRTTLLCLFHHSDQAQAALEDLRGAGVPDEAISVTRGDAGPAALNTALDDLAIPERDQAHLLSGLQHGGTLITVFATGDAHAAEVDRIFSHNRAEKIDEAEARSDLQQPLAAVAPVPAVAAAGASIPVIDEELEIGKRTVDRGGLRLYRRVIEIPVDENVALREEHVNVERHSVDRPVTDADQAFAPRTISLTETAEEAVVQKQARVVEEVRVSKETTMRTEHIHDTVRRTQIDSEEIAPGESVASTPANRR